MLLNINTAKSGNIPAVLVVLVGLVCAVQLNQELLPVPCQLSGLLGLGQAKEGCSYSGHHPR